MALKYSNLSGGPVCYEFADVTLVNGVREISYQGSLTAVIVPTDSDRGCHRLGLIFDERRTLIVDCLHDEDEVNAFRATCEANQIATVAELTRSIRTPCPPPPNQIQVASWSAQLFTDLRPAGDEAR
jgi:hypothetical protein